ncbi:MAG: hypothetical protein JO272_15655 [Pseudonocardiales bacterium]|nr:hypothetical protein [Pseudonocardiales bacterium]
MLAMRPAVASDIAAVEAMIYARCGWLEERGLPSWRALAPELAEPAYYLYTSVTDPAYQPIRPGTLMAWWAVDKAARDGRDWVRRGCLFPGLVRYYRRQGFTLVHEVQRTHHRVYLMGRRAEVLPELAGMLAADHPVSPARP